MNSKVVFDHPTDGPQEWLFDCPFRANRAALLLGNRFKVEAVTERYGPENIEAKRVIQTRRSEAP